MSYTPGQSIELKAKTLNQLAGRVAIPSYDRSQLIPGIVHFGVGGFNRSHLAVYLDDLLQDAENERWGECGVGLLTPDGAMHDALQSQNVLYSVVSRDEKKVDVRIIGSLTEHIYAPTQQQLLIDRLSSPSCKIVSLTVTEGGYFIDDATQSFKASDPSVQHDLEHPENLRTFLGFIAAAAEKRMQAHGQPFTVMSCDNVQHNGDVARQALLAFAKMRSDKLAAWIESNVTFPNSMVDRITPMTTDADRQLLQNEFGIIDCAPVVTEPFRQWVLEDTFINSRPRFEAVGVELVEDVTPYEITKMRLLNGAHLTLAYVGALLGHTFVSEAITDELILDLVHCYFHEVTPVVPYIPTLNIDKYKAEVVRRFANPTIRDQIMRICSESAAKMTKFLVPSVNELSAMGKPVRVLAFVVASWLHAMLGRTDSGDSFRIVDVQEHLFADFLNAGGKEADQVLSRSPIFGDLCMRAPVFVREVQIQLDRLHAHGAKSTLSDFLIEGREKG